MTAGGGRGQRDLSVAAGHHTGLEQADREAGVFIIIYHFYQLTVGLFYFIWGRSGN